MNIEDRRYAVLIDADNVSDKYVKIILDEISNLAKINKVLHWLEYSKPHPFSKLKLDGAYFCHYFLTMS